MRSRWAAIGAAIAVTLGAGGVVMAGAASSGASVFVPIVPCRLLDTRPPGVGGRTTPLGVAETATFTVHGTNGNCTVPATAIGVAANVTTTSGTALSYLTIWPAGGAKPTTSTNNWNAGQAPTPNSVDSKLSIDGKISIYNDAGTVHVIVDIVGFYEPAGTSGGGGPAGPAGPAGVAGPAGPVGPTGATGISTGHIDGATGAQIPEFAKSGNWTSSREAVGLYRITIPGMVGTGCAPLKPFPNPVVSVWNTGAVTTASAFINGVGSDCGNPGSWSFYVKTTLNGVVADSEFNFTYVTPV